jgi:flagellar motor switch protein FliN
MPETPSTTTASAPAPVGLPDFGGGTAGGSPRAIGLLSDVTLQVRIELGRTKMLVEDVLKLNPDSVVELDKAAGDPVDIYVNGRKIARGEVLVLNENFCVRVSEILESVDG